MIMKKYLIQFLCGALILTGVTQSAFSEEQENLLEKLEQNGISIGGLSDDPHRDREDVVLSEAEKLLWETDQLANIEQPGTIRYEFERKGTIDEGFTDSVELNILKVKDDGMKSAAMIFFTGDRNQEVPPNENTNGNPVLSVYLQGDVYEMNRLTEGNWRYFHRRIKLALSEDAKIEPVTFQYNGKEIQGKKVTFTPYVNDPKRKMFENYADKIYEIIVSEEIPGMIFQIHTVIPGVKKDGQANQPLVEETLVYAGTN